MQRRQGIAAFTLATSAVLWSAFLLAAAFFVDVYSGVGRTSTLVEVNGLGVLVPMSIPLASCIAIFVLLRRLCTRGSHAAGTLAGVLAGLLVIFSLISGFSVGMFVMPAAVAALLAATITPEPR